MNLPMLDAKGRLITADGLEDGDLLRFVDNDAYTDLRKGAVVTFKSAADGFIEIHESTIRGYSPSKFYLDSISRKPGPAPTPPIDLAYSQINALGGTVTDTDLHGKGYCQAVDDVLAILKRLGAKDAPYAALVESLKA